MRLHASALQPLAALLVSVLVVGCDSTGTSSEDPPSDEEGAVSFSLVRTANSDVPTDADSAFVRVWKPDGSFNLREFANIPDPGQQTEVSLDVPADNGYRAGVLAVESSVFGKKVRAHGSSGQFSVQTDDTSQVSLDVRVSGLTIQLPNEMAPGTKDTIETTYQINIPNLRERLRARQSEKSEFRFFDSEVTESLPEVSSSQTDSTVSESYVITAPSFDSKDTTHVRVAVDLRSDDNWVTSERSLTFDFFPGRERTGPSFDVPVNPGSEANGTVVIVFSKTEDGWEKTRQVVE